jgi:hypothetical protein
MADSADSKGKRRTRRDSPPDGIELSSKTRALIHGFHARLVEMNLFEVLGVDSDADVATLRRGYFERSKLFHPDRYFNKNIGHYKKLLEHIFQWVSAAFKFLKDDRKREAYRQRLLQGGSPEQQPTPAQPPRQPVKTEQQEAGQPQEPPTVAPAARPAAPIVVPVERDSVLEFVIADEDDFSGKPVAATPLPPPRSPTPPPVQQPRSPTPPPVSQTRSPTPPPVTRPRSPTPPPVEPPARQAARAPREERTQADDTLEFYVDD